MHNKRSLFCTRKGRGNLKTHHCLALAIGAFGAMFPLNAAFANSVPLPQGDFTMKGTFCASSPPRSDCEFPVDAGYWIFNSDASVTNVSYDKETPDWGAWSEGAPGQLFVEFFWLEGNWTYSSLLMQISGGDFPCYYGLVETPNIGALSLRLCLEP